MIMREALGGMRPPVIASGAVDVRETALVMERVLEALNGSRPHGAHPRSVALILLYYDGRSERIAELIRLTKIRREYLYLIARELGYVTAMTRRGWTARETGFLQENLGYMTLSRLARKLGRSEDAVRLKAKRLGLRARSNQGCYSVNELSVMLGIDRHVIYNYWIPMGLHTFSYSPQRVILMVDPVALQRFWRRRPEAYDYMGLSMEMKMRLGMIRDNGSLRLPEPPLEKELVCRAQTRRDRRKGMFVGSDYEGGENIMICGTRFWVELYRANPRCPRCGKIVSSWAAAYRGTRQKKTEAAAYDDAAVPLSFLGAVS